MIIEDRPGKNQNSNWWANRTKKLLEDQKETWQLLKDNYLNLSKVETKDFDFDGFQIKVQYNPERIKSTAADVNDDAVNSRECFLCHENLPKEQNELVYDKNYIILCNPYPIFNEHFTISKKKHKPQNIIGNFGDILNLTQDLGSYYTLFYNGPKCGSSAPDHMHFQAGTKLAMPLENEVDILKSNFTKHEMRNGKIEIRFIEDYLRYAVLFESSSKGELVYAFKIFVKAFKKISPPDDEPMMNIVSTYNGNKWSVFIFPRAKHRPSQYFLDGKKKLLISPAAVDLSGLIITPRKEDFEKITTVDISNLFRQVILTKEYFEYLKKKIGEAFLK